jgi:histidinol-phosphate aminotransferase
MNRRQWMKTGALAAASLSVERSAWGVNLFDRPQQQARPQTVKPLARLWGNENPYGPSEKARRAMQAAVGEGNRYATSFADYAELEGLIAEREGLTKEHVVLGSGSGEVLCMAGVAYGLEGAQILACDPTFPALMRYAEAVGGRVLRVPLNDRFEHDLDQMMRRLTGSVRLVYVCNPNNPTGTIVAATRLRAFCEEVSRRTPVLVDEAYLEYADAKEFGSMIDMVRKGLNVIVVRTFSKIYALAGMRVGYALARPEIIARLRPFRMGIINQVGLRGAIASYKDEEFVQLSRRKNLETRAYLYRELEALGRRFVPTQGNFVWLHAGREQRGLPEALAARGVFINGNRAPLSDDWARVTLGTMEEMKLFVSALREVLEA